MLATSFSRCSASVGSGLARVGVLRAMVVSGLAAWLGCLADDQKLIAALGACKREKRKSCDPTQIFATSAKSRREAQGPATAVRGGKHASAPHGRASYGSLGPGWPAYRSNCA